VEGYLCSFGIVPSFDFADAGAYVQYIHEVECGLVTWWLGFTCGMLYTGLVNVTAVR
jgi:hypothetical protein